MTRTGAAARPQIDIEERAHSFMEWVQLNMRAVTIGAAVVVAIALGGWLYLRAEQSKEERASQALSQANESVLQGNYALAQTDLERVVREYGNTDAGKQAVLALSEVLYLQNKYQEGVKALEDAQGNVPDYMAATFKAQIGAGYEQLGNFAKAGDVYQEAAEAARFEADRALFRADAARAYTQAGNTKAALQIWQAEADNQSSPVAAEARIRIGELTAQSARKAQ